MSADRGRFRSLRNRNYRRYFIGQTISVSGEWAQRIGQAWLVLELTGSGTLLGVAAALQHAPTVLIGPWGGLLADRVDKRRLLLVTQAIAGLLALLLAVLTATGVVTVEMVLALAFALGCTKALDKPAKQAFVLEMVGGRELVNAVALNAIVFNIAKAVGPALAGILIARIGIAANFFVNAATYLAALTALALIDVTQLEPADRAPRGPGQLRAGLAHVWRTPELRGPILLMTVSGILAYEWAVTLPILARDAFDGDAQVFGAMFSAMGIGAVVGGVMVAGRIRPRATWLLGSGLCFGTLLALLGWSPSLTMALALLAALGGANVAFRATATALLQLRADPQMRGRVMSLLAIALTGTTTIGGPLIGWMAEQIGIRPTIAIAGLATAATAVANFGYVRRRLRTEVVTDSQPGSR